MDGAWIGSVDIVINKAFMARAFDSCERPQPLPIRSLEDSRGIEESD